MPRLIVHGFTISLDGYGAGLPVAGRSTTIVGGPLLAGIDLLKLGYTCEKSVTGEQAVHYSITRA